MYHGIILNEEFVDPNYPDNFKVFAKKKSANSTWILYGIEVENSQLQETVSNIQKNMKSGEPYYAHLYNNEELIVIFKDKIFNVKPHESTWKEIIDYGERLNIPPEQLDFWPNRFQDERHYFEKQDYL